MGILWCAPAALLWAMPLWSWMHESPTYRVECSVTEVFAGGAQTPRGSFTIVLREGNKAGYQKGWRPLEGRWEDDPTLSVAIKAVDTGRGNFTLDVDVKNIVVIPGHGDGPELRGNGIGSAREGRDDFAFELAKADESGGHYEFRFHRKGGPWYQALLP